MPVKRAVSEERGLRGQGAARAGAPGGRASSRAPSPRGGLADSSGRWSPLPSPVLKGLTGSGSSERVNQAVRGEVTRGGEAASSPWNLEKAHPSGETVSREMTRLGAGGEEGGGVPRGLRGNYAEEVSELESGPSPNQDSGA